MRSRRTTLNGILLLGLLFGLAAGCRRANPATPEQPGKSGNANTGMSSSGGSGNDGRGGSPADGQSKGDGSDRNGGNSGGGVGGSSGGSAGSGNGTSPGGTGNQGQSVGTDGGRPGQPGQGGGQHIVKPDGASRDSSSIGIVAPKSADEAASAAQSELKKSENALAQGNLADAYRHAARALQSCEYFPNDVQCDQLAELARLQLRKLEKQGISAEELRKRGKVGGKTIIEIE